MLKVPADDVALGGIVLMMVCLALYGVYRWRKSKTEPPVVD